jgi:hypothetical protein
MKKNPCFIIAFILSLLMFIASSHAEMSKTLNAAIVKIKMDTDSNNDGTIDATDDAQEEESPGKLVPVNDNDDNSNRTSDLMDTAVTGENDLSEINVSLDPEEIASDSAVQNDINIQLEASSGASHIKLWDSATKSNEISLPKTYNLGTDTLPSSVYLEGSASGETDLDIVLKSGTLELSSDTLKNTIINVDYSEDSSQSYGFDNRQTDALATGNYLDNLFVPWKSVRSSHTDSVIATIADSQNADHVYFTSTDETNVTVSPPQAASATQTLTINGIRKGNAVIQANLASENGKSAALLNVSSYDLVEKTLAIILVHEDNDDVQDIAVGQPAASTQTCVSSGTNLSLDTNPAGDDIIDGTYIRSGPDGTCDTTANNTDILSTDLQINALETYLNETVYNQAVLQWTVTRLTEKRVNFDLNRDGQIDVSSWPTPEMQVIIDECGDSNYDHNIFLVDNPSDNTLGYMSFGQRYGFVHLDNSNHPNNTVAHELGHGAFSLEHPDNGSRNDADIENLMHSVEPNPWRLRKYQWDIINP